MHRRFNPLRLTALALVMGLAGLVMAQEQALPPARQVLDLDVVLLLSLT